ncbi:helix-turn-helix domain-containing protein [Streptomyces sp. NPDC046727]|uniref:helix-turn-helix domain-containing protein n=1 Tax=Streptomyces sp. NPDC046727 TaxID=3155373 RepID=UPI0033DFBD5D
MSRGTGRLPGREGVGALRQLSAPGLPGESLTVSSWIREQRPAHARRDLADPALRGTPIHMIASRWGFPRAADFSRAFRNACGIPPKDYRDRSSPRLPPSSGG